jgi:cytochrome c-type biogenesis protein CcmE
MDEQAGAISGVSRAEWTSEDQFYLSDKAQDLLVNYSGILDANIRSHSIAIVRLPVADLS